MISKKGKLFSIWWYAVLVIVGSFIVFGTFLFYGTYIDARSFEAEILSNKISDCLLENKITSTSLENQVLENCNLYKPLFESNSRYFIMISFPDNIIKIGNRAFEEDCKISSEAKAKEFPKCFTNELELNGELVKIVTGSNARGKEVQ